MNKMAAHGNKEVASENIRPFENEVTIVDEFGFIGKSFSVKKVSENVQNS